MENTIFKPIDVNVDLMKAVLSKKQFEVANEAGDELSLRLEDVIALTVNGKEQRYYVMKTGGGEYKVFQATEDGGVAALLRITDRDICDKVYKEVLEPLLNKFDEFDTFDEYRRHCGEDADEDVVNLIDNCFVKDGVEGDNRIQDATAGREKLKPRDLLDVLLDPNNKEPLTFLDENGRVLAFEQVAVIPHDDKNGERQLFTVLKPLDKIEGVADDEAIVFRVSVGDDGNTAIKPEEDDETALAVYDEYIKLLKAHGVKIPDED